MTQAKQALAKELPPSKAPAPAARARLAVLRRVLSWLVAAYLIGWVLNYSTTRMNQVAGPAGFTRGLVHGALMPMAAPNLLIGNDVTIYAPVNTGRLYKLGYTVGVNGCGALFFGFFFWRLSRWRRTGCSKIR